MEQNTLAAAAAAPGHSFPTWGLLRPIAALLAIPALVISALAAPPDLTNGGVPTDTMNINLGPTGMHGWMYHVGVNSGESRQILVTGVEAGSPAAGVLAAGDVILGVDGTGAAPTPFTSDARIALGMAIGDAEANNPATLKLLRWRAGVTETVEITLQTMGSYSATAPYNCAKSALILEQGLQHVMANQNAGTYGLNTLTLLAGNDPANPANAARQARAQTEARALILTQQEIDARLAGFVSKESKVGWRRGHELVVLSEYYLQTGDTQVLPTIEAMAVEVCNGMSVLGTYGHQFTNPDWNGGFNGPYNIGYGVINSSGLVGYYGLLLARECGITRPELAPAIARATNFFAGYAGFGAIPYGEHVPYRDSHESNGKSGLAALALSLEGSRADAAGFFTKMAAAAASEREIGHTGSYFNYLWAPLGANVGGVEAVASHFSRIRWRLDLNRRWDGGFEYDCWYDEYGAGGLDWVSGFWMNTPALLTYALPLRQLEITGKDQDPSLYLSSVEVGETALADTYDATTRSTVELVADLGLFSPKVQDKAAKELALRTAEHATLVPQLIAIANDTNAGEQRVGACIALAKIGSGAAAADLAALLTDSDERVRWASTYAMRYMPNSERLANLNTILAAAAGNARPFDPIHDPAPCQFANAEMNYLLFYPGTSNGPTGVIAGNRLNGVNRNLLYPAVAAAAQVPLGAARGCVRQTFENLTAADVQALGGTIVDAVMYRPPADKMFNDDSRIGGLNILRTYNVAEGIPLAKRLAGTIDYGSQNHALDVLALYAGSCTLVNPDPDIPGLCDRLIYARPGQAVDAQEVLDAIATDTNPVAPIPFKGIQSVTAQNPALQLPAVFTGLDVVSYDHAKGDTIYTWRKVHGAGLVTFAPNGVAAAKNTTVVLEGIPGQYLFEVTMSDSRGLTEEVATVAVTLYDSGGGLPPNSPPSATAQSPAVPMSTTTPITLAGTDPEGYALGFRVISGPSHGSLAGTAPNLTYTPDYGYSGADSFTFEVMDSEGQTDTASVNITVSATATLQTAVYEPFDYPAGLLNGRSGSSEVGFAGPWAAHATAATVTDGSLEFGNLVTVGGKYEGPNGNIWGGTRAISPSALASTGLLNDGATLWLSAEVGYGPAVNYTNARFALALGNNGFSTLNGRTWIINEGAQLGRGVGFVLGRMDAINGRTVATAFLDSTRQDATYKAEINGTWEDHGALIPQGGHALIVARITWAADPQQPDLIELFQPLSNGLALPDKPFSVVSTVVDQTTFDTLTFTKNEHMLLDEVRIGPNYESVLAGTQPLTADVTAPGPVGFATLPTAVGDSSVTMEAAPAYDPNGVEYYFTCTAGGGNDSGWQSSPGYTDSGLTPGGQYSYTVMTRDLSPAGNTSGPSAAESVTLPIALTIPSVVGMAQASAESYLEINHFSVGTVTTLYNELVPAGRVISQNPAAGTSAAGGTAVDLLVSLGSGNNPPQFINDPVVAGDATADAAYSGTIAATATDPDPGAILSYYKLNGPAWLNVATDGTLSGTPGTANAGLNVFSVKVVDENGLSDTAALHITVDAGGGVVLLGGFYGLNETALQSPSISGITITLARTGASTDITQGYSQIDSNTWGNTTLDVPAPTIGNGDDLRNAIVQTGTITPFTLVMTVTNGGTGDLVLDQIHYDIKKDVNNAGPNAGTLTYTSGNLTDTPGASAAFAIPNGVTANDIALGSFLTDTTLAAGESATFTWAHGAPENPGGNHSLRLDNFAISGSVSVTASDTTAPTLSGSGIIDDQNGGSIFENDPVTYTVIFSEDMDAATVSAVDFSNAGSAPVTIGTLAETSPGVFSVEVTPTGTGSLQLQVSAGAVLTDAAGNTLDTTSAIADDTVITVNDTNVAPAWVSNPVSEADAAEDAPYSGTLADDANDANASDNLEFAKVSGPAWLNVATDGTLSGTPTNADVGLNVFTVSVTDTVIATPVQATLNITVLNTNDAPVVDAGIDQTVTFAGGVPWTPASIATVAWFDAADAATIVQSGGLVSQWNDKSGNANHAVQTTGARQPTYQAADPMVNNMPSIGNPSLNGSIGLDTPSFGSRNVYVVAYYKDGVDSSFDGYSTLFSGPGIYGQYRVMGNSGTPNFIGTYNFNDTGTYKNGSTTSSLNAVLPMPAAILKFKSSAARTQTYALGYNRLDGTRDWQGAYCEWIFTDGTEDAATEEMIEGYLAHKWGLQGSLPAGHAYKISAPGGGSTVVTLDGTVSDADAGDTVSTTWSVFSGPGPVSFGSTTAVDTTATFQTAGTYVLRLTADDSTVQPFDDVTITVEESVPTNNPPTWAADPVNEGNATEDTAYSSTLADDASDADNGAILTFAKVSGPAWLSVAADGTLSGTPSNSDVGLNVFTVSVTDTIIATPVEATLNITVLNINDAPVFTVDPITGIDATEDTAYAGTLAGSTTDEDSGAILEYAKVSGPAWLSVAPDGTLSGTPTNDDVGPNAFTVSVTDHIAAPVNATLNITVVNTNDAPVFTADPITGSAAIEDAAYIGTLAGSATDDDGDPLTYAKLSGPAWLSVAANGALSGTPPNAAVGSNSFTVSVSDGIAPAAAVMLNITVINTNDAPVWTSNPVAKADAAEDAAYSASLASDASDMDVGDTLAFAKVNGPAWLTVGSNGTLSGTPTNSDVGANVFTVSVTDGIAPPVQTTLNISVTNTNDAPVFTSNPIVAAGAEEGIAYTGQTLAGTATDADAGDSITYSKVSGPAWLAVASNGTLSGTPPSGSAGLNSFVVRATDSNSATADATLQITVTGLPLPWVASDIGTGMLAGSTTFSAGTFTQAGSGVIGGTADKLRFTYQTLSGDGEIIARISNLQNTGNSSRVGVMIRDSLAANSKQIFMGMTSSGAYRWVRRTATGGSTSSSNSSSGTVPNTWVRLVRSGTTITAYKSTNGTSWTTVGSTTGTTFASTCYIGLAVGSGSDTTLNTSQFSNVSVTP